MGSKIGVGARTITVLVDGLERDHDDQQVLLDLLRRLLDTLAATSTAEGRPLNLDTEAFRSG